MSTNARGGLGTVSRLLLLRAVSLREVLSVLSLGTPGGSSVSQLRSVGSYVCLSELPAPPDSPSQTTVRTCWRNPFSTPLLSSPPRPPRFQI